jgi:hypothetical protein
VDDGLVGAGSYGAYHSNNDFALWKPQLPSQVFSTNIQLFSFVFLFN